MQTIERASGVRLELPAELTTTTRGGVASRPRPGRPDPLPLPAEAGPPPPLLTALAAADLIMVDTLELDATPTALAQQRSGVRLARSFTASLELPADSGAVLLLEQDGVFSWHLPDNATGATRRAGDTRVRFEVPVGAAPGPARQRGLGGLVLGRVRAWVLRFVVQATLPGLLAALERGKDRGLLWLRGTDTDDWQPVRLAGLPLPQDRPARLLLWLHGTFSSSVGSFGALTASAEGRALLETAAARYDAVLGFDHPTLSLDPTANAQALLAALTSQPWPLPPHLDIVTYSRGGLVYRALAELLLPQDAWRPHIDRVIFVAVPNGGTQLCTAENWHTLLDLYTNLAAAAATLLGAFPAFTGAAQIFSATVSGLAAFAKALTTQALTAGDVPGLAAMDPAGPWIATLNQVQPGQPGVDSTFYCAVTASFDLDPADPAPPVGFPRQLAMMLADRLTDRLFAGPNDLVVDTAAMTAIDPGTGPYIKAELQFPPGERVYHTIYFAQPRLVQALLRWLDLEQAQAAAAPSGDWVPPGGTVAEALPVEVNTDFIVANADEDPLVVQRELQASGAPYVVVHRRDADQWLHYALRREEVTEALEGPRGAADNLREALDLHEWQASVRHTRGAAPQPPPAGGNRGPIAERGVVFELGRPVGVVPGPDELGEPAPAAAVNPPTQDPVPVAPAAPVQCHFYAEMPGAVQVGRTASLVVQVSRELIEAAAGGASAGGAAAVDPARRLILDVRARRNFIVSGEPRAEFDPPPPGAPAECSFDLLATDPGPGEVWVTARQGQPTLLTLRLHPTVTAEAPAPTRPVVVRASTDEPGAPTAALCQLRISERLNGAQLSYDFELDVPGRVLARFASAPLRSAPGDFVAGIYADIEGRWRSSAADQVAFTEELREIGAGLFHELFPLDLQRALWTHREALGHVVVLSTEPFIPWELVHLTEPGAPLPDETLFLAGFGLVRWLYDAQGYFPEQVRVRAGRSRYLIPDYPHPDQQLPATAAEAAYLREHFGATPVAPHPEPLRQLLQAAGSFDLLHFAGHGVADGADIRHAALLLEGRREGQQVITEVLTSQSVDSRARLGDGGNRPLVLLNACQVGRMGLQLTGMGGFAKAFLSRGAGIFVSSLWSVTDAPAKDFALALYDALAAGEPLAQATITARAAARQLGDASWLAYVVYGHPQARVIFEAG